VTTVAARNKHQHCSSNSRSNSGSSSSAGVLLAGLAAVVIDACAVAVRLWLHVVVALVAACSFSWQGLPLC
jgi:hypothetical protein